MLTLPSISISRAPKRLTSVLDTVPNLFSPCPLCNHADEIIGVLQLVNAKDPATGETISFSKVLEPIVIALASSAAIALDNQILLQDHKDLLDAFIKVIAQAIDAKSQHTSAHCQRVPGTN
jgi:hypothetical protein